jgi:ribosome-associated protein
MAAEEYDDEREGVQAPSKSARKRSHKAMQDLGVSLLELSPSQLDRVPLAADLREAVLAGRALRKSARARHVRHLGNLLARQDDAPVRMALQGIRGASARDTARLHRAERWRARLLDEGDAALGELLAAFPLADRQRLRALVRAAHEERSHAAAPRRQRELLRLLRALEEAAD